MKIEELTLILGRAALFYSGFKLTPEIIKSWFELFSHVDTRTFQKAVEATIKAPNRAFFPSPGEVNAEIMDLANSKKAIGYDDGKLPWISKAPKYQGEKFLDLDRGIAHPAYLRWQETEAPKRYRSVNEYQDIFLIQNPDACDWCLRGNQIHFIRPEPTETGEKRQIAKPKSSWATR